MSDDSVFDVTSDDDRNFSLVTPSSPTEFNASSDVSDSFFVDVYRTTAGTIVFLATIPFLLFHFRCFPARTTSAALFGAALMVIVGVVSPAEAYRSIGREDRLTAVFLLVGMTLVAEFAERERLVRRALRVLLSPDQSFIMYSFRVCALAYVLAIIVSADAACVLLIPVLVECFHEQERPKCELETLLLGAASSATLGAAATLFGGPSIALIAAASHVPPHLRRLDLLACFKYLVPTSLVCFGANFALVLLHNQRDCFSSLCRCQCRGGRHSPGGNGSRRFNSSDPDQELSGLTQAVAHLVGMNAGGAGNNGFIRQDDANNDIMRVDERLVQAPTLETILEDEVLELPECGSSSGWSTSSTAHTLVDDHPSSSSYDNHEILQDSSSSCGPGLRRTSPASDDLTSITDRDDDYVSPRSSPTRPRASVNVPEGYDATADGNAVGASAASVMSRSLGALSTVDVLSSRQLSRFGNETMSEGRTVMRVGLLVVLLVVFVLLIVANPGLPFDIGLVPFGGALVLVALETAVHRRRPTDVLHRMDWSVILLFFAVFVWTDGFLVTRLPAFVWHQLNFIGCAFTEVMSVVVFCVLIVSTANVVGQVPITIMILDQLSPRFTPSSPSSSPSHDTQQYDLRPFLYLAWTVAVCGNLTLVSGGSGAVIVSNSLSPNRNSPTSSRHPLGRGSRSGGTSAMQGGYQLTFCSYLRFTGPASGLALVLGISVISALLMIGG